MERRPLSNHHTLVIAGSSLGPESDGVVRTALALARRAGGRVAVVHVLEPRDPSARDLLGFPLILDTAIAAARERLAAQLHRLGALPRDVSELAVELPPVHVALLDAVEHLGADLLVVGANTGEGPSLRLGSAARRILRRAVGPLWVVKSQRMASPAVVLLPFAAEGGSAERAASLAALACCLSTADAEVRSAGAGREGDGSPAALAELALAEHADLLVLRRGEAGLGPTDDHDLVAAARGAPCSVLVLPAAQPTTGPAPPATAARRDGLLGKH